MQSIGLGSVLGFGGIVTMSFGAVLENIWLLRAGIIATTISVWLITWSKSS